MNHSTITSTLPITVLISSLFIGAGCASSRDTIIVGATVGAVAVGSMAALATKDKAKGAAIGGVAGASIGGIAGYMEHKDRENRKREEAIRNSQLPHQKPPSLLKPRVRSLWVPGKVEGSRFVEGHVIYEIESPAQWSHEGAAESPEERDSARQQSENGTTSSEDEDEDKTNKNK